MVSRLRKLERLNRIIRRCEKCELWKTRTKAVPGEGPANAKIMFIGEAPGRIEDEIGRPFVGRAGELLNELIEFAGLKRENVFITSPIKCRPPKNRKPKASEIEACLPYLQKQIGIVNPKIIVLLGNTAIKTILSKLDCGRIDGINKIHGKTVCRDGKIYFLTFHPAAGIRAKRTKRKLLRDFKILKNLLKRNKL